MKFFTDQKTVAITREVFTGNISAYTTLSTTSCYLRPLSETEASNNGYQYGTAFSAIFEVDVDVRTSDKLTIDGQVYTVKGVATFDRGNVLDYRRALVTKPQA